MIVVTGAAGFIGSQVARHFGKYSQILAVDKLPLFSARPYLRELQCEKMEAEDVFLEKMKSLKNIELVIHMGAISNTAERDQSALDYWNINYTKKIWEYCTKNKIPLVYASSAATYGDGKNGFSDDHSVIKNLKPLNLYGKSKQTFDLFALEQQARGVQPPSWYGLKFFNVYGPFEDHKDRMASSIWHGFHEIKKTGQITLFKSHHPEFKDGEQARDFIFIVDILKIMEFLIAKKPKSGIYNCGTGRAETFLSMAENLFQNMKTAPAINWIPTPEQFRAAYQYKTQAKMEKLRQVGFTTPFTPLSLGVKEYLKYLGK